MIGQMRFGIVQKLDDERNGTIEGWNPAGWLARCYHPTAEAALQDARRASPFLGRVYVVEHQVPESFKIYWPHPTYWQVRTNPPFVGIAGAFYIPKPNYYIVDVGALMSLIFEAGEPPSRR